MASVVGVGGNMGEGLAKPIVGLGSARGVETWVCRQPARLKRAIRMVEARIIFVMEELCLGVMELIHLASEI